METTLENNTLTLYLEGRIDSAKAQTLEAEFFAAVNANPEAEIAFSPEAGIHFLRGTSGTVDGCQKIG